MTRFEPSFVQIWLTVRPVGLAKKTKKERKERKKTMANWPFTQTTHVVGSKSKFAWRMASIMYVKIRPLTAAKPGPNFNKTWHIKLHTGGHPSCKLWLRSDDVCGLGKLPFPYVYWLIVLPYKPWQNTLEVSLLVSTSTVNTVCKNICIPRLVWNKSSSSSSSAHFP